MESKMMKRMILVLAACAAFSAGVARPAAAAAQAAGSSAAAANAVLTAGEVRSVDATQGKVTIRHETITNLDMPAMTMVFRAAKPGLLKGVKAGDKVRFHAEMDKGTLVVTHIEAAK
jgi:Cu(I)/Ag(I) efflux system periplasmic protein CusF